MQRLKRLQSDALKFTQTVVDWYNMGKELNVDEILLKEYISTYNSAEDLQSQIIQEWIMNNDDASLLKLKDAKDRLEGWIILYSLLT